MPTIKALLSKNREPSSLIAFSVACMLCFLTPISPQQNGIHLGKLSICEQDAVVKNKKNNYYGDKLKIDLTSGEYQFRNDCDPSVPEKLFYIANNISQCKNDNRLDLLLAELFQLDRLENSAERLAMKSWLSSVSFWYFEILPKDPQSNNCNHMAILRKIIDDTRWLKIVDLEETVKHFVNVTPVIDVHTHLFPASHGSLMLYGIDDLLTYHYLVAEYFQTAPSDITTHGKFYKINQN